jgi:hypothetical protein
LQYRSINISLILLLLILVSGIGMEEQDCAFDWLDGIWKNDRSEHSVYENWHSKGGSNFHGISYRIIDSDTAVSEVMELVKEDHEYYFIATVAGQNNNLPVKFKLDSCAPGFFRCSNYNHDFPQMISYQRISKDSLETEIAGNIKGEMKRIRFTIKRI